MTGKTHLGGGLLASLILCDSLPTGMLLSFGSVLPDIDHGGSMLGKNIPFVSKMFRHRGFTHSLLFAGLMWLLNEWVAYGVMVHIFLDLMTKGGVSLLWPVNAKMHFPLAGFVRTGGRFETIVFCLIYLCIIFVVVNKFIFKVIL